MGDEETSITHTWECPNCCDIITEIGGTKKEFVNTLVDEHGVRMIQNEHMIGTFCKTCIDDPEFNEMTL